MAVRRRHKEDVRIDVGAFADVAFLLIIFFILTTAVTVTQGTLLDLPQGEEKQREDKPKNIQIQLAGTDILYGERGEALALPELRLRLERADLPARAETNRVVILSAKADVPYSTYFSVVNAIHGAGGILAILEEDTAGGAEEAP